jgi:hypothetical protein
MVLPMLFRIELLIFVECNILLKALARGIIDPEYPDGSIGTYCNSKQKKIQYPLDCGVTVTLDW